MSRYYSYLNSAKEILLAYNGEAPFASFIKKYFAKYKKHGSKDRKQISHLCYCYFRLGKAATNMPVEERILMGLFLCSAESNETLGVLPPGWNDNVRLRLEEKFSMFNAHPDSYRDSMVNVFPWIDQLSEGIDHEKFAASFFIQPDLFLRLRPGNENIVKQKLQKAGIRFDQITDTCIALPNSSGIDQVIELNKEAVVQDYSSQQVGGFFQNLKPQTLNPDISGQALKLTVWDCCAASGGKSIMLYDLNFNIDLAVSDIRESILSNLRKRFAEAGIRNYKYFVKDLTKDSAIDLPSESGEGFNFILCDAPCSGSGTWSRTPEQLYYFEKNKIDDYASLQKKIVSNVIPHLKPGGYFLYITCSVFKKENEEMVEFIKKNFGFGLIKMEVLKGYDKKADTMFAALFQKPV